MRSVRVEMLHILAQHDVEMAWSSDQEVVEAFPSQGADEAFRDRVRRGCSDRRPNDPHVGADETASKDVVNLLSRSRIRNRNRLARSPRSMSRLRAC